MADRLALGVIPGAGWSAREIQAVARAAGVTLPILMAPIGVAGARSVIQAFRR